MSVITYFSTHNHNLSTPSRILAMEYLIKNEVSASTFIDAIYFVEEKQKIVLFHVLDMMVEHHINYLDNNLDFYLEKALKETHESTKRCVSRTLYHQLKNNKSRYNRKQKQQIILAMFDWIILPSAVATRVNAIHVLYFLVDEEEWIKEQLIALIEQNMQLHEASFVSRGKKILKLLHKRKS